MIDYKKYPKDWKTKIRPDILKRAENKCEFCGIANYSRGYREPDGTFKLESDIYEDDWDSTYSSYKLIKIVLTIAHLDHNINNNDYNNLKALCQRCHLNYDKVHHKESRRKTRFKNQPELFFSE